MITLVSFNTNGIRARQHQIAAIIDKYAPYVLGLQETKVRDEEFPLAAVSELGYHAEYFGQKGHYGVALLSAQAPLSITKGYPFDGKDAQRRVITGRYKLRSGKILTVVDVYFPQGESRHNAIKFSAKKKFYAEFLEYLRKVHSPDEYLAVMGDFNVAPVDADIGIGADNAKRWLRTGKCSFLPEEREWFQQLIDWGLVDSFRHLHPDVDDRFSWFDYRSRGFERKPKRGLRIDHILVTRPLARKCVDAGIDYDIRAMDKPSDHCPVWAKFKV